MDMAMPIKSVPGCSDRPPFVPVLDAVLELPVEVGFDLSPEVVVELFELPFLEVLLDPVEALILWKLRIIVLACSASP